MCLHSFRMESMPIDFGRSFLIVSRFESLWTIKIILGNFPKIQRKIEITSWGHVFLSLTITVVQF